MPLYEYQCENCGERFETMQKFADAPLTEHEKCGGPVHRLISAPALQFKGSGWYITDYAKKDSSASSSGKSENSSASGSGDSAKTDEKKADGGKTDAAPAKTESSSPAKPSSKD